MFFKASSLGLPNDESEAAMDQRWDSPQIVNFSLGTGPHRSLRGPLTIRGSAQWSSISRKAILMCSSTQLLWDKSSKCSLFELLGANT